MRAYLTQIVLTASTLINVVTGGVWPETMSYRAAKARRSDRRWGCLLCRILDLFDRDHCFKTMAWWERSK